MTAGEFYKALAETRNGWTVGPSRHILRDHHCPITAVALHCGADPIKIWSRWYWETASKYLGLRIDFACQVVKASDNNPDFSRIVRKKLLKALGLEGEWHV